MGQCACGQQIGPGMKCCRACAAQQRYGDRKASREVARLRKNRTISNSMSRAHAMKKASGDAVVLHTYGALLGRILEATR